MPSPDPSPGTRARLIAAMSRALQRRGLHGVGLTELLSEAQAPKGVLYHHFPGGKTELAVAAIEATAARITASLDQLIATRADPVPMLRSWLAAARQQLEKSAFEQGCPLATVALESTADDEALRHALAAAFAAIRLRLAAMLASAGVAQARARNLATLIVAAYEGALMQARVAGDGQTLGDTAEALLALVQSEVDSKGPDR
jgi:TetR/AcrR family transcriptional repressor of lmrAB and yxaGH operons